MMSPETALLGLNERYWGLNMDNGSGIAERLTNLRWLTASDEKTIKRLWIRLCEGFFYRLVRHRKS